MGYKIKLGEQAKEYHIADRKMFIYRRVLDEISFPIKPDQDRYDFLTDEGEWGRDKIILNDERTLKAVMGDDYRYKKYGYTFITEQLKEQLIEKYKRQQEETA